MTMVGLCGDGPWLSDIRSYAGTASADAIRRFDQILTDRERMVRKKPNNKPPSKKTPGRKPAGPRGGTLRGTRPTGRSR